MSAPAPAPERTRPRDRPLTVALLLTGLYFVTRTVAFARNLPVSLDQAYIESGIGRFASSTAAVGIGYAICALQVLALVLAIAITVPRMREGKSSAWVPLAIGAAASGLTLALLVVAMATDPSALLNPTR